MRIDLGLDEGADRVDDHLLFFGQCEIHCSPSSILVRAADRSSTIHCGALGQCLPLSSGLPLTLTLSPLAGRGDVPHGRWGASGCGISLLPASGEKVAAAG
ncbi:hypothetical protein CN121_15415 [Sinorhizobium meliloti]|nr:hypothetical protein CN125_18005 [Sinorhizobium meliloti]RVM46523.1 hypothetical protein CN121_15415 [Sinorhizobium meliloti]RVM63899.1 hypothetical protein CN123_23845 [Sinorhizobium meliloti]RVM69322.1 hypothetical protein CN124_07820 [Sinorhizobium meliloti]RVM83463.1 hypothetical protein CN117_15950 [Sinorhizobium meliloti]